MNRTVSSRFVVEWCW